MVNRFLEMCFRAFLTNFEMTFGPPCIYSGLLQPRLKQPATMCETLSNNINISTVQNTFSFCQISVG